MKFVGCIDIIDLDPICLDFRGRMLDQNHHHRGGLVVCGLVNYGASLGAGKGWHKRS